MTYPKVSIFIPTYNRANYLPQAIESALAQDYPNLEVVVSDNASMDNTQEVIKKYMNNPRFKYFRNLENVGLVKNWRKALYTYATGDWALMLSDDDYLLDNSYISKAIDLTESDKEIVLVFANYKIHYDDRNTFKCTNIKLPVIMDGKWAFWNFWTRNFPGIGNLTALFDRKKALELDAFGRDIISPDTELWFKLLLIGKIGFLKDVVAVYRLHGDNQILKVDLDKRFKDIEGITEGARFAMTLGLNKHKVEAWQKRLTKNLLKNTLHLVLKKGTPKDLKNFIFYICNQSSKYLSIFFETRISIKLILFFIRPHFLKGVRNLYQKVSMSKSEDK